MATEGLDITLDGEIYELYSKFETDTILANGLKEKSPLDSPEFTGKPVAPSPVQNSNDNQIATTQWVNNFISENVNEVLDIPDDVTDLFAFAENLEANKVHYYQITSFRSINNLPVFGMIEGVFTIIKNTSYIHIIANCSVNTLINEDKSIHFISKAISGDDWGSWGRVDSHRKMYSDAPIESSFDFTQYGAENIGDKFIVPTSLIPNADEGKLISYTDTEEGEQYIAYITQINLGNTTLILLSHYSIKPDINVETNSEFIADNSSVTLKTTTTNLNTGLTSSFDSILPTVSMTISGVMTPEMYNRFSQNSGDISDINSKLDVNVEIDTNITSDSSTLTIARVKKNLDSGTETSVQQAFPVVSSTQAGVLNSQDYKSLLQAIQDIQNLQGRGYVFAALGQDPTQDDINAAWVSAKGSEPIEGSQIVNIDQNNTNYIFGNLNGTNQWVPQGNYSLPVATDTILGGVLSSTNDGEGFINSNGVISTNGWDIIKTNIINLQNSNSNKIDITSMTGANNLNILASGVITHTAGTSSTIPENVNKFSLGSSQSISSFFLSLKEKINGIISNFINYVPITRTINSKPLNANITLAKADIGLGNVDNTSDLSKPISTATQTALNGKFDIPTGTTSQWLQGNGVPASKPTSLPPSGSAGGDLTGTYPNPTITTDSITIAKQATYTVTLPTEPTSDSKIIQTDLNSKKTDSFIALLIGKINRLYTSISNKFDKPGGTTNQYITGSGSLATFPTIPTVGNGTITLQKNGSAVGNFSMNQTTTSTINMVLAKADVGLGNVDNTSDVNKPISTATQTALDNKIAISQWTDGGSNSSTITAGGNSIINSEESLTKVPNDTQSLARRILQFAAKINGIISRLLTKAQTGTATAPTGSYISGITLNENSVPTVTTATLPVSSPSATTYFIDSDQKLSDYCRGVAGNDYTVVEFKYGSYSFDINSGGSSTSPASSIDLVSKGTQIIKGNGATITININAQNVAVIRGNNDNNFKCYDLNCLAYGNSYATNVYAFYKCNNLINCTGFGRSTSNSSGKGYGFYGCNNIINCNGKGSGQIYGYSFYECNNIINCNSNPNDTTATNTGFYYCNNIENCNAKWNRSTTGTGSGNGYGFENCNYISGCSVLINENAINVASSSTGYGFSKCNNITNCIATVSGTDTGNGYGFSTCNNLINCHGSGLIINTNSKGYGFADCKIMYMCSSADIASSTATFIRCNGAKSPDGTTYVDILNSEPNLVKYNCTGTY